MWHTQKLQLLNAVNNSLYNYNIIINIIYRLFGFNLTNIIRFFAVSLTLADSGYNLETPDTKNKQFFFSSNSTEQNDASD